jgi:hypothetical protein
MTILPVVASTMRDASDSDGHTFQDKRTPVWTLIQLMLTSNKHPLTVSFLDVVKVEHETMPRVPVRGEEKIQY